MVTRLSHECGYSSILKLLQSYVMHNFVVCGVDFLFWLLFLQDDGEVRRHLPDMEESSDEEEMDEEVKHMFIVL